MYDESRLAADVLALLDALEIESCALAGHDIGSAVAPVVARLAPERVGALALFNPTHPYIGERRNTPEMQAELWHHAFHAQPWSHELAGRDRKTVALYLGHFLRHWTGEHENLAPAEVDALIDTFARPGAMEASFGWYRSRQASRLHSPPRTPPPPVACPTFVAWGTADPVAPVSWRHGIERAYPRLDLRVLEGIGHFVPVEAPEAAAERILTAAAAAR